jgi:hypothetical protein
VTTVLLAFLSLIADGAVAEQRQVIDAGSETVSPADAFPQRFHEVVIELHHVAATMTDEMVVRLVDQLELTRAATQVGHADETEVAEALEGAVDRRTVDRRELRFNASKDFVRRKMLARLERTKDDQSLWRGPLPDTAQPFHQTANAPLGDRI